MSHILDLQALETPNDEADALVSTESWSVCFTDPSNLSYVLC